MQRELAPPEVSDIPELEAVVAAVQTTQQPRRVTRGGDTLALLIPPPVQRRRRPRAARGTADNAILQLARMAESIDIPEDLEADISENKDKYLADAYAGDTMSRDRI